MPSPLVTAMSRLRDDVDRLRFAAPVAHVYDPLGYAWAPHRAFVERYGRGRKRVLFLGMNPGPYGMTQTGVPFGEPTLVRDFLGIHAAVERPRREHPKRPITGFATTRAEVSGTRFWGFVRDRFGTADAFFADAFVMAYCPLVFLEESGRNRTPDKLPRAERAALYAACDRALDRTLAALEPEVVIGIGRFALARATAVAGPRGVRLETILHPSPASPAANRGWAETVNRQLDAMGLAAWRGPPRTSS